MELEARRRAKLDEALSQVGKLVTRAAFLELYESFGMVALLEGMENCPAVVIRGWRSVTPHRQESFCMLAIIGSVIDQTLLSSG